MTSHTPLFASFGQERVSQFGLRFVKPLWPALELERNLHLFPLLFKGVVLELPHVLFGEVPDQLTHRLRAKRQGVVQGRKVIVVGE